MAGYNVRITESSTELTPREKIKLKDLSNAYRLDQCVEPDKPFIIKPVAYAVLEVENEHSKQDKQYRKYLIVDDSGNKYHTGSESFWNSFTGIWEEMHEAGESDFEIEIYERESRNYAGKTFLTCSLI